MPSAPTVNSPRYDTKSVSLSWSKPEQENGLLHYEIWLYDNEGFNRSYTTNETALTVGGLDDDTQFHVLYNVSEERQPEISTSKAII